MRIAVLFTLAGCASAPSQGFSLESTFARVQSSVVTVVTQSREVNIARKQGMTSVGGLGSGVLISNDGQILTAAHVVQTADRVVVLFSDGMRSDAEVIGSDTVNDVALLRLRDRPPANAHVALLSNSDAVRVGQRVFVVGAPRGISHTLTVGHISARRKPKRAVRTVSDTELFQTDAAINQGNSGGPMFDMNGTVIGIVSHIISASGGSEGLGFAVTVNVARDLLIDAPPFWSGMELIRISGPMARILNLPEGRSGLLVQRVAKESPAARMGIRGGEYAATISGEKFVAGGDIILEVAGIKAGEDDSYAKLRKMLTELKDGQELEILILRGGALQTLKTVLRR